MAKPVKRSVPLSEVRHQLRDPVWAMATRAQRKAFVAILTSFDDPWIIKGGE